MITCVGSLTSYVPARVHAQAIELYHQSLSLKPDDTFTCEMLSEALKDTLELGDPTNLDGLGIGGGTGGGMPGSSRAGSAASAAAASSSGSLSAMDI